MSGMTSSPPMPVAAKPWRLPGALHATTVVITDPLPGTHAYGDTFRAARRAVPQLRLAAPVCDLPVGPEDAARGWLVRAGDRRAEQRARSRS